MKLIKGTDFGKLHWIYDVKMRGGLICVFGWSALMERTELLWPSERGYFAPNLN